jgi:NADH-quinone oxidoreductase subunit K
MKIYSFILICIDKIICISECQLNSITIVFSGTIFIAALGGVIFNRSNLINLLLYTELGFFIASFNFMFFSKLHFSVGGFIMSLYIIALAAAEAAIGLGLLINFYQIGQSLSFSSLSYSKG